MMRKEKNGTNRKTSGNKQEGQMVANKGLEVIWKGQRTYSNLQNKQR